MANGEWGTQADAHRTDRATRMDLDLRFLDDRQSAAGAAVGIIVAIVDVVIVAAVSTSVNARQSTLLQTPTTSRR